MNRNYLLICFCFFCFANCTSEKKDLPNTPERVARQWQKWVDDNEYELAKELSTKNATEWLVWVEEMFQGNEETGMEEEELLPAVFLSMQCKERGDLATCSYVLEDNGLRYRDSFQLQKIEGQWLVDIPEQDLIEDNTLDDLLNKSMSE